MGVSTQSTWVSGQTSRMKVVRLACCLPVVFGARPDLFDAVELRGTPSEEGSDVKSVASEPATKSVEDASEVKHDIDNVAKAKREAGLAADAKQEVGGKMKR